MSTTVDSRVVEMRFDNQHFEKNVSTSMSTLDKLKQRLNLTGATKGLENVEEASRKINFSGLSGAVETVQAKFSALQIMGITALTNITNSAVNAGKRMASALTIDPIKTGLSEYETQINAVQTILANTESKGSTLQDVSRALDELNTYADKTIYNFTEMTRNIGTFTAAGVTLDNSVSSIQGIANLAAISGSTSQQASNAMYQLSQALAAGRVSLMDWNSVVNAGMGGQVFQDALKRTAKTMGIVVDESKSFRESISGGDTWLSSDVLLKTLEQFTMAAEEGSKEWETFKKSLMDEGYTEDQALEILKMANTATDAATKVKTFTQLWDTLKESAQSGWTQTWETIIGDFGEAKRFLTEISNTIGGMIGASAESRNLLLSEGLTSGWKQLLGQGITDENRFKDSIKTVAKEHSISIDEMIAAEKKLDESLTDDEAFQKALKTGFAEGALNADIFTKAVTNSADGMRKLADDIENMSDKEREEKGYTDSYLLSLEKQIVSIEKLEEGLKNGEIAMDDFTKKISRASGRENIIQGLWNSFNAILAIIEPVKQAFSEIFPAMKGEQLYEITVRFKELTEQFMISEETAGYLNRTFKGVFALMDIGVKAITALFQGFAKLVGFVLPAGNGILSITAGFGDFVVSINEALESSDAFNKIIESISNFLKPLGEGIKAFGSAVFGVFENVGEKGAKRFQPLVAVVNFLKSIFSGLANLVTAVAPVFTKLIGGLGDVIGSLFDGIGEAVQGANYDKLFDIINGGVFALIGVNLAKFLKSAGSLTEGIKDAFNIEDSSFFDKIKELGEGVKETLSGVSDALNAFTTSLKVKTLKDIAIAMALLAGSLFVLSIIDSDKLLSSLGAVTVLFGELIGALTIFTKISSAKTFGKVQSASVALISLSASILILSIALKILSTMSWDELGVGLTGLTIGLGALIGAIWLLPDGKFKKATKAIRSLTSSLIIFAVAMKIMGSMSWGELARGLTGVVVGLGALVGALHLLPKDAKAKAGTMIAIAAALVIMGAALKIMGSMSWGELARSLVALCASLIMLTVAMTAMLAALPGAMAMKTVSKALIALSIALKIMATMSWEEIAKSLVALAGSLLVMSLTLSKMKAQKGGAKSLLTLAASLLILAPVLKYLGGMSWEEIAKGLVTLAGAFVIIGIAGAVLGPMAPAIAALAKSIALLSLACIAVGAGVLMFGLGIASLAAALASSGAAITLFIYSIIGLIPYLIEQIGVGIINLCRVISGGASAICEALKVIIVALVDAIVVAAPAIAEGIFVVIDELLALMITYIPKITTALFDFLIGIINAISEKMPELVRAGANLIMSIFSGVLTELNKLDPNVLLNGILAVGFMYTLVAAMAGIAAMTPAALVGVLAFGVIITELSLVLAAIGALAQIPGLEWLVNEGGDFLQDIGNAIGKLIGGLIGGIAEGALASLPQMGTYLSDFMSNLSGFLEGATSIDASSLEGVKSLAGVILALTAADVLNGIASWIGGGSSLASFGEELAAFAPNLKAYADSMKDVDPSVIESSANAAMALSELAGNLPNSGGLVGFFVGENDIGAFGEQLVPFGEGMKAYSDAIAGFDEGAVIASANAAKALADMTSHIPNEGGLVAWFTGDNSISSFGSELEDLANGLIGYSNIITGFNPVAVALSISAAKALVELTSTIPNEGGLAAWFTGDNSIASFAGQLPLLGYGLASFSESISGISNMGDIEAAATAAKAIADMTNYIPKEGGIAAWFTGESSIANFAGNLPDLGEGIKGFADSISGITNMDDITAAAGAAKAIADMTNYIPKEGGIAAWFTGDSSIASFADKLPELGEGLKGFSDSITGIVPENVTTAANAAQTLATMAANTPENTDKIATFGDNLALFGDDLKSYFEKTGGITTDTITAATSAVDSIKTMTEGFNTSTLNSISTSIKGVVEAIEGMANIGEDTVSGFVASMKKMGEVNVDAMLTAFSDAGPKMTEAGSNLMTNFTTGVSNKESDVKTAGENVITKFSEGVKSKENTAKKDCVSLTSTCITGMKGKYDEFKKAGKYLVEGFANGIELYTYIAKAAATNMANSAETAAKSALDEHSPSRVFMQIGKYVPEGFAIGINSMLRMVKSSSTGMADTAIDGVRSAISKVADAVSTDIDAQPTIRPVLDLSDVRAGAGAINGLFGTNPSVGVLANVGTISSMMNGNQNGTNSDIISAIDKLRGDLSNIGGNNYNINGITYDDGSNVANAIQTLVRATKIERRV